VTALLPPELFAPCHDRYGVRLALVFGNHAPGGRCPWFEGDACHHCDIGAGEGAAFDLRANHARLGAFVNHYGDVLPRVAHLLVYNSGSVLSRREMPRVLVREIVAFAAALPALRVLSLDTREPYITRRSVLDVARGLGPGRVARPVLGLESADDRIRERLLEKRMPRSAVLRAVAHLGEAAREVGAERIGLDCNVLLAGPGTTPATAVDDALSTARFITDAARGHGVSVDLNVHPYYPSVRGLRRFPDHPRCSPALAASAARALRSAVPADTGIFVGWHDEGHDQEPARRARELATRLRDAFDAFNRTQDPAWLDGL